MNVLAFGIMKEIAENPLIDIDCPKGATVADLKVLLEEKYAAFKKLGSYMIAVNNEYVPDETIINQGDEVAVIPPVSGG
jgi:molybdopterin converting factor subunit 1